MSREIHYEYDALRKSAADATRAKTIFAQNGKVKYDKASTDLSSHQAQFTVALGKNIYDTAIKGMDPLINRFESLSRVFEYTASEMQARETEIRDSFETGGNAR
jgi:hypothetical protein